MITDVYESYLVYKVDDNIKYPLKDFRLRFYH